MNWSSLPRGKKILVLGIGIVVLAVLLTVLSAANQRSSADDPAGGNDGLDNPPRLTQVTVKATKGDQGVESFLDAIGDRNGNCSLDDLEEDGFAGQTEATGVGTMNLPDGQYVIRATPVDGSAEGVVTVAVGKIEGTACAVPVPTSNTEPITINVGQ